MEADHSDWCLEYGEECLCAPVAKPWAEMSLWEKFTDKDPSRPEKTWRNRWFWGWKN